VDRSDSRRHLRLCFRWVTVLGAPFHHFQLIRSSSTVAAQIAAQNSLADPKTYTSLSNKLRAIVLECIGEYAPLHMAHLLTSPLLEGFTDLQKDVMRSIVREKQTIDEVSCALRLFRAAIPS
jgi:hypothetical protein